MTDQTPTRVPFADRYPLETFAAIADAAWWRSNDFSMRQNEPGFERAAYETAMAADKADQARLDAHKVVFTAAAQAHLEALRAEGALSPITGIEGRNVTLATAWNDFVADKPATYTRDWLMKSFDRLFVDEFVRMDSGKYARKREDGHVPGSHQAPTDEQVAEAWKGICTRMDAGTSREYDRGLAIEVQDQKTGDRGEIHFSAWRPTLMLFNEQHRLEPAQDVATPELVQADFAVPTGRLLLTDYLRVEGFKEGVDFGDREYGRSLDLNSARGRDARIAAHAQDHQIAYTQTTNTCVAVRRNPETGALIVTQRWISGPRGGELPEDEHGVSILKGWETVGAFSCDMWRTMAFDRATAIGLMEAGGRTDAETELDAYLASSDCYARNVVQADVEPGLWRIHSGDEFSARVDRKAHGIPKKVHVWCLLERVGDLGADLAVAA